MNSNNHQPDQRQDARALRQERIWLLARHDTGAIAPQAYTVIKLLEGFH
jgi:hypothetical protein